MGVYHWYEIQDSTAYYGEFDKSKIISTDIAKRCEFTIDTNGSYIDATLFCMPIADKYLLGVLNSSLVRNILQGNFQHDTRRLSSIQKYLLFHNTRCTSGLSQKRLIVSLVTAILAEKAQNPTADVTALEAEIDCLVYGLYGLTAADFQIVEDTA